jgi:hypothetical protein
MIRKFAFPVDNDHMRDERGVVLSWLVKLLIGLAIGSVILYDVGSIVVNYFTLDSASGDIANEIATDVSTGNLSPSDVAALEDTAERKAKAKDAKLVKFDVDEKGAIHIRLRRTANTLIVSRIGPIEDWGRATVEGKASTQ